ncbi:MAG TPA: hypothetical protein ENK39_00030 [Epsilonproteobacteria bacterium]|nr:hypothetical protein [Campylobacterota bacterium]
MIKNFIEQKFHTFIKNRYKGRNDDFIESKVIPTYKIFYAILLSLLALLLISLPLLFLLPKLAVITVLISIIILMLSPIWIIYSPYILFSDKVIAFFVAFIYSIGVFAASYYIFQDAYNSNAFHVSYLKGTNFGTWFYYSIVIFSTLGFGDIVPKNDVAMYAIILQILFHYIYMFFGFSILMQRSKYRDKMILSVLKSYK